MIGCPWRFCLVLEYNTNSNFFFPFIRFFCFCFFCFCFFCFFLFFFLSSFFFCLLVPNAVALTKNKTKQTTWRWRHKPAIGVLVEFLTHTISWGGAWCCYGSPFYREPTSPGGSASSVYPTSKSQRLNEVFSYARVLRVFLCKEVRQSESLEKQSNTVCTVCFWVGEDKLAPIARLIWDVFFCWCFVCEDIKRSDSLERSSHTVVYCTVRTVFLGLGRPMKPYCSTPLLFAMDICYLQRAIVCNNQGAEKTFKHGYIYIYIYGL